ncbi:fasciclin domain-containing protein [bacterium]|nr:MAG: fasciclin domain-containing protein [bacterium]
MKNSKRILPLAIVLMAAPAFSRPVQDGDIVAVASSNGSFKTLVAAVKAAGLVEALQGNGPFTVFAPTDAAFNKLEKHKPGTIAMLLKPENKAKLAAILKYHVVPGKVTAADVLALKNNTKVKTLQGSAVAVKNKHGVMVDKAKVVKTDVFATNGVIHVIDTVLMPK